jgi:hypothetical protein
MSDGQSWRDVTFAGTLTFSAPVELTPAAVQGADTAFGEWRGDDVTVRIDAGLFVDPLTRYGNRPNVRAFEESIDGEPARGVTFDEADGSRFTAVHFPDLQDTAGGAKKLTFVVISGPGRPPDDAMRIVRSIRFQR